MAIQTVYTSGSGRIRGVLTDCNGTQILPENVAGIRLNIFRYVMGNYDPVRVTRTKRFPRPRYFPNLRRIARGMNSTSSATRTMV